MEDGEWERDEKPYLIFTCSKCKQYSYVKTTQKTKKCLRCGRQHKVASIINSGEIVKGMTKAVETVKLRQNELTIKKIGTNPGFRAVDDFSVASKQQETLIIDDNIDNNDLTTKFQKMLKEISKSYSEFPFYVLEIMAENFDIPLLELKILVRSYQKKGILIRQNGSYSIK